MLVYKLLNDNYISEVYECWKESFADYQVDMSYYTLDRMVHRAQMDRVDFDYSIAAFDQNKMVGFILVGIDQWKGYKYAFDAGTGVIKDYRGKGITGKMFEYALPSLKEKGVERFVLEVIQTNDSAVKAYSKSGFEIVQNYECYKINVENFKPNRISKGEIEIKALNKDDISKHDHLLDWEVSWEYNRSAIQSISDAFYLFGAFFNDKCVGYLAYYPRLHWIFQLAVDKNYRKNGIEELLLNHIIEEVKHKTKEVKVHNILQGHYLNAFFNENGFEKYISQYEMERKI